MSKADTDKKTVPNKTEFEALTLEHLDALYRHALSLTRKPAEAEDLVQEAYLKAFRAFGDFRPGSNVKAWLFKILRNTFISDYRKKKAHPEIQAPEDDPDFTSFFGALKKAHGDAQEGPSEKDLTDPEKLEQHFGDEVLKALETLSEDFREVIFLCDIQGLAYQDIADVLEVPVGTVRSRLARARKMLQQSLWQYAQDKGLWRRS